MGPSDVTDFSTLNPGVGRDGGLVCIDRGMTDITHSPLPDTPAAAIADDQAWDAFEGDLADGTPDKVTVDDFIAVWLVLVAISEPPEVWHAARRIIGEHVHGSRLGKMATSAATSRDVDNLLGSVARHSGAVVEGETHQTLNLLFMSAWRHELVTSNPTGGMRRPKRASLGSRAKYLR